MMGGGKESQEGEERKRTERKWDQGDLDGGLFTWYRSSSRLREGEEVQCSVEPNEIHREIG